MFFPDEHRKGTHRWAAASDHDVDTLCVKRVPIGDDAGHKFNVNGFKVYKFRVHGRMTAHNIRKTCAKKDMMTPYVFLLLCVGRARAGLGFWFLKRRMFRCDHPHYADGHCIALFKSAIHISYNPVSVFGLGGGFLKFFVFCSTTTWTVL